MENFVISQSTHTLQLENWEKRFPQLVAGFTIRTGGNSEPPFSSCNLGIHVGDDAKQVIANRQLVSKRLGMPFSAWTSSDQVHGNKIAHVTESLRGAGRERMADAIPQTDGLHTNEPGILLTSFYADCVPLFFLDPDHNAVGLAHAGWKGTVARIAEEMVDAMASQYGTKPHELQVAIGPSIGGCCYQVDERVIAHVKSSAKGWETAVQRQENDKYLLDLRKLNQLILQEAGVLEEYILVTDWCTSCRTDLFFSHRKEAGKTGRMASYIGWKQEGAGDQVEYVSRAAADEVNSN